MEDEDLDIDVGSEIIVPDPSNPASINEVVVITIEQIADLFGVQEVLGCGATFNEYQSWYDSLGLDLTNQVVDTETMFQEYQSICDSKGTYFIPKSKTKTSSDNKNLRTLAILGGALLFISQLKK